MNVTEFIADYSSANRGNIEFRSNGKEGPNLIDENSEFRLQVFRALQDGQVPSDELIRDLYDAESQWSQAAWCARHQMMVLLSSELLRRGGVVNVRHFLRCLWRGQDCYLSSLCFEISPAERAVAIADMELAIAAENKEPAGWRRIIEAIKQRP